MTRKTLHVLVALIVGLVLLLFVMQRGDRNEIVELRHPLLPDFQSVANDATEIRVGQPDRDDDLVIRLKDDKWVVSARDDYAADLGILKQLVIALANARIVEEKTSDPERYGNLGVGDPQDGGRGTMVVISGPEFSYAVILGDSAQHEYRYARIPGEAGSYLIDRSPDVPQAVGDWLMPGIVDIPSIRIRRVVISHADGETITIGKSEQEQTDFDIIGIPEGRELSYATVGNGIAGALGMAELEDVRARIDAPTMTNVVFETWEDLRVSVDVVSDDDSTWVSFAADLASEESDAGKLATEINERVSGWQYQITDYKTNLLTNRWDDILKAPDDE